MTYAVVVVDMINDFVKGILTVGRAKDLIPRISHLLTYARAHNIPIIYVNDSHLPNDREFKIWGGHAIAGTAGSQVVEDLKPLPNDIVLQKMRYSAFFGTSLDNILRELKATSLVITGIVTNICIQHTVAGAFFRGYEVTIPQDCVEAFTEAEQKEGLEYIKRMYGSNIVTLEEGLKLLGDV